MAGDLTLGLPPGLGLKHSNSSVSVLGAGEMRPGISIGGIAGFDSPDAVAVRCKLCKVASSAESRASKSGPGLSLGLGGRGEGLRGPRGRLPDAFRGAALSGISLTSASGVGKNRFVGVVERWLRPLPEARDDGRNGSGGLSMSIFNMMQETSKR